jgi:hypothetical protein
VRLDPPKTLFASLLSSRGVVGGFSSRAQKPNNLF